MHHSVTSTEAQPESAAEDEQTHGKGNLEVIIRTTEEGFNGGRSYIYRSHYDDAVAWEADIDQAVAKAKARSVEQEMREKFGHSHILMTRARAKQIYQSNLFQCAVATLIILAFVIDVGAVAGRPRERGQERGGGGGKVRRGERESCACAHDV